MLACRLNGTPYAHLLAPKQFVKPIHPAVALRRLASRLQPLEAEVTAAYQHTATIRARLEKSFHVSAVLRIGSHSRGTAIRTYSDVDLLAVLRRKDARWGKHDLSADTFMRRISDDLRDRYTTTDIRRDGQAVVLQFRRGEHAVDLVPGVFQRFDRGHPVYRIPGSAGQWIETSPLRHNRYFQIANAKSGGKLRHVSQLLKAWRHSRQTPYPLSSFYTDMLLASSNTATGVKSYADCLIDFFAVVARRRGRGLQDPEGISGVIPAAGTPLACERLTEASVAAMERAERAIEAQLYGDFAEANRLWAIVFNRDL